MQFLTSWEAFQCLADADLGLWDVTIEGGRLDSNDFNNDAPYSCFGHDKCGFTNILVHFIFRLKNPKTGKYVEHHLKNPPKPFNDKLSHVYTAIIYPDNMLKLLLDGDENQTCSLQWLWVYSCPLQRLFWICRARNLKTGMIMPRFQILLLPSLMTGMRKHPENWRWGSREARGIAPTFVV